MGGPTLNRSLTAKEDHMLKKNELTKLMNRLRVERRGKEGENRIVEGIAYNAAIKGNRRRVTCEKSVWDSDDDDIFYWDESVRYTEDQLRDLDLVGLPLRVQHDIDLDPVGEVISNWVDDNGHMHIIGEVWGGTQYGKAMSQLIDHEIANDLSIGYSLSRNKETGEVTHLGCDEISFVTEAHFEDCGVTRKVTASRSKLHKGHNSWSSFRVVTAGRNINMDTSTPPPQTQAPASQEDSGDNSSQMDLSKDKVDQEQMAGMPNDELLRNIAKLRQEMRSKEALVKDQVKKLDEQNRQLALNAEKDGKRREEYAEKKKPESDMVINFLKQMSQESELNLTEDHYKLMEGFMLSPEAHQMQTQMVTCARSSKSDRKQIAELREEVKRLQNAITMGANLAQLEGEDERRQLTAGRNTTTNTKRSREEAPQQEKAAAIVPAWVTKMMGNDYQPGVYNQTREVTAKKSKTDEGQPAYRLPGHDQGRSTISAPTPLRKGFPLNEHGMRNSGYNSEVFKFMKSLTAGTQLDGAMAHLAGDNRFSPAM